MIFFRQRILLTCLLTVSAVQTVFATNKFPLEWKSECIGHYQIDVPGDIEIALTKRAALLDDQAMAPIIFEDGSPAPYSVIYKLPNVGPAASLTEFEQLRLDFTKLMKARKKEIIAEGNKNVANKIVPNLPNKTNFFGWRGERKIVAFIFSEDRVYNYDADKFKTFTENEADLNHFFKTFQTRKIFETPKENGVCFPYGFLVDAQSNALRVSVTMRLKDHPDVEVFFKETTATPPPPPSKDDINFDADKTVRFFLEEELLRTEQIHQIDYSFPKTRSVKIDGREGKASFVEIIRANTHQRDFAYVAYLEGDPKSTTDAPDLMLYVVRNAARAKGEPVSKSELKEIIQKIVGSVRRHHSS